MRKTVLTVIIVLLAFPAVNWAQQGGAFVGSIGIGLTSAQGDFSDGAGLAGGSGSALEAELRYYLFGGFSIGGFVNYSRFGSAWEATNGRVSYNFNQLGGAVKMNFFRFSNGRLYLTGGGGMFIPTVHYYIPDASYDIVGAESGQFFFGGFGLISKNDRKILYELEVRYNIASADFKSSEFDDVLYKYWDFIYIGAKVSFASKGKPEPPKY